MSPPVLSVRDLSVIAKTDQGPQTLVDRVSFELNRGEILGLVGESGSGKSMTCRAIIGLLPSSRISISGGSVILRGKSDLTHLEESDMRKVRGGDIGMIFQNPSSHLDPVMSIGGQITESIRYHHQVNRAEARNRAIEILHQVGISDPAQRIDDYPHEFSGGMRQRAMIAVALACNPEILIADEPTTALDVTVQAQILRLLMDLREKRELSIILITHDLGVVAQVCDTVAVMYGGRICERGPKREIILDAHHPYTTGLIDCQPSGGSHRGLVKTIAGQPPSQGSMPTGCAFHPRCAHATKECAQTEPAAVDYQPNHMLACHHPIGEINEGGRA